MEGRMRIYAVADIHGRPARMALIQKNVLKLKPDVLVVAGDITHFTGPVPVISRLNEMPAPVLAVRGNTDLARVESLFKRFPNVYPLHLKEAIIKGVRFVGLSGTLPLPFASRICLNEAGIITKLKPLLNGNPVLVAHPPPRGTLDQVFGRFHAGCRRLKEIVITYQPKLMICGHIHETPGTAFLGNTRIVNCSIGRTGGGAVIDVEPDRVLKVEMI
jgi:Icc-related predicted phosphoesterase